MVASRGCLDNTSVSGTWNWKYLRKTTSIVQGIFILKLYSAYILSYLIICLVSDLFPFDIGETDLRSNPLQEREYDATQDVLEHFG